MESLLPGLFSAHNLHPLFVHAPLVLWPTALVFWVVGLARASDSTWRAGTWLLVAGTVAACLAVLSGFIAADSLGHDSPGHDAVHVHRNLMLASAALAALLSGVAVLARRSSGLRLRRGLCAGLFVVLGVMSLGADRGVELVYRFGLGTGDTGVGVAPPPPGESGHGHEAEHGHGAHAH